jgi:hypothetical protein
MPNVRLEKPKADKAHIFYTDGKWTLWTGQSVFVYFNSVDSIIRWVIEHKNLTR